MIRWHDQLRFNLKALLRQRFRTLMQLLAMAIGVFAVVLLTGLGEGGRRYVINEFSLLGKDVLIMLPGRKETTGGLPPLTGEGTRDITLQDARAVLRHRQVSAVAPIIAASGDISAYGRSRESLVIGTNHDFFAMRQLSLQQGQALPAIELHIAQPVCVIGAKLKQALFAHRPVLGQWLGVAGHRCRVIGVLADTGTGLGMDMSHAVLMPVASTQQIFNAHGLFRLMIQVRTLHNLPVTVRSLELRMQQQHDGQLDVTLITPDSLLAAFDSILAVITMAVAAIGGISLSVAGVLIMNMTLISVSQRTAEIGLLKALGSSAAEIRQLFIGEALLLTLAGASLGIASAEALLWAASQRLGISFIAPWWASALALLVALGSSLVFSWSPASRAAGMAPVQALQQQMGK